MDDWAAKLRQWQEAEAAREQRRQELEEFRKRQEEEDLKRREEEEERRYQQEEEEEDEDYLDEEEGDMPEEDDYEDREGGEEEGEYDNMDEGGEEYDDMETSDHLADLNDADAGNFISCFHLFIMPLKIKWFFIQFKIEKWEIFRLVCIEFCFYELLGRYQIIAIVSASCTLVPAG